VSTLTLAEAKQHLAITDTKYDEELPGFIDSAEAALAQLCGPLESTEVTRRVPGCSGVLVLPVTPALELTTVTPQSGAALTLSDLYLDTVTGMVTSNTLGGFGAAFYTVVYDAGRTVCPADLLMAVKELVRHMWETRRGNMSRAGTLDTSPVGAAHALPYRVTELIAPHLQPGVG